MSDEKKQAMMEKITALMQKTVENGASEAEAIQAALMAQKLMVKYGIDEIRLIETDEVGKDIIDTQKIWTHILIQKIAKHYCLRAIRSEKLSNGEYKGIAVIYGRESDRKIAINVINMLMNIIKKNADVQKKIVRSRLGHCRNVEYVYALGFIGAVIAELEKQTAALMVIVPDEVTELYKKENSKISIMSGKKAKAVDNKHNNALSMVANQGGIDGHELMKRKQLS